MLRLTRNGQFHLIHNFSHLLPPKHLIFGEISKIFISGGGTLQIFWVFQLFQIVSHQCGWKWPTMANLAKKWLRLGQNGHFCIFFYLFPQNEAEITCNGQFHLIHNFSHLLSPKHLIFGEISKIFISGGHTSAIFLSFPTFSNRFTPMRLEMTHNGKFGQKSGLDWVKMAIFAYFSIFSPKMMLRLVGMVNFTWFTTFPIFCHQSISFLEKSQKFSFLGGGILAIFGVFQTFSNCFTTMRLEMTHNGKFGQKSGLDWAKTAIFAYFSIFSPKMRLRLLAMVNFTWFTTFPIFCHQSISFLEKSQKFSFLGGWYIGKFFWVFQLFQFISH